MTHIENLPDEMLINILYYTGINGTNNYINAFPDDFRAKDNLLWYEFSKDYYNFPYDSDLSYYDDVNYLLKFLAEHDENDIARFLLKNNEEDVIYKYLAMKYGVNHQFNIQNSKFPLACFIPNVKLADLLLGVGLDINIRCEPNGETCLFWARNKEMANGS